MSVNMNVFSTRRGASLPRSCHGSSSSTSSTVMRAGRAGERGLAQQLVLDAGRVDDAGLREVALVPVERGGRDRDARARRRCSGGGRRGPSAASLARLTAPAPGTRTRWPPRARTRRSSRTARRAAARRPARRCRAPRRSRRSSCPGPGSAAAPVRCRSAGTSLWPSAATIVSTGPASRVSSRPIGLRNQRTRTSSSTVRCAIIASVSCRYGRTHRLPLRRARLPRGAFATGTRTSRCGSSCIADCSAPRPRARASAASLGVASRERDRARAPRRPAAPHGGCPGSGGRELRRLARPRARRARAARRPRLGAQARRLQREAGERLAPRGGQARLGGELHGPLQVRPHPRGVPRRGVGDPAPRLQPARAQRRRMLRGDRRGPVDPRLRRVDLAQVEVRHRGPAGRQELERAIAHLPRVAMRLLGPREIARSGITFARANTWTPKSICASNAARSLSFVNAFAFEVSRRISSMWRAELRAQVDVGRPAQVAHRDDRRHRAAPVAEPLEELERLLRGARRLVHDGRDRELGQDVLEHLAGGHALRDRRCAAAARPARRTTPGPGRAARRRARGAPRRAWRRRRARGASSTARANASSAPSRSTSRAAGANASPAVACRRSWPSSMQAASSPPRSPRSSARPGPRGRARRRGRTPRRCGARRRGAAGRRARGASRRAPPRARRARRALEAVVGPAEHVERAVARLQQVDGCSWGRGRGQRDLDDAQDLLGRVRGERVAAGLDREPHADGRVARGLRVVREQRQARGDGSPDSSSSTIAAWIARRAAGVSVAAAKSRTCSCGKL